MDSIGAKATLLVGCLVSACGGGSTNDPDPRLIAGGGIDDGAIDGVLNVHVIDEGSDEPISGAVVRIGEAGEEPLSLATDSGGLSAFDDERLAGPTTITVVADGYVVSTWFGANGANVTMPLEPVDEPTDLPRATVTGTIAGWDELPLPATNHLLAAIVSYSQTRELGDPANELEQPAGQPPPNVCVSFPANSVPCSWSLVTRSGTVAIVATILDLDSKGTDEDTDDTLEILGYAYAAGMAVEDAVDLSDVVLEQLPADSLVEVGASYQATPSGFDETGSLLQLDLGDSGLIAVGFIGADGPQTLMVPALAGDFASNTYRAIAIAGSSTDDPDDDENPMSAIIMRGIDDLSSGVEYGAWMDSPANLALSGADYGFTPVAGAALHTARLLDGAGDVLWSIALLDGRDSFALPELSPDPLPAGDLDLVVDAFDVAVDLEDFALDELIDSFARVSKGRRALTR